MFTLLMICLIRALRFKPAERKVVEPEKIGFDRQKAVSDLKEMIKIRTVSYNDTEKEDSAEFEKFIELLPRLFPLTHKKLSLTRVEPKGLLYKWQGKSSKEPTVLMAHFDVVPADEGSWSRPPFEGVIENETLWGRGTLDTKGTLNGIFQATERLLEEGFVPENDIYFSFAGDEETQGDSTPGIVALLKSEGIKPALVVDEGGAVVENVFPGVKKRIAVVGAAEKGVTNVRYKVKSGGGHSSTPPAHTPIGILSRACAAVENNPFKMRMTSTVEEMFDNLGRHSTFLYRLIFANLWLFKPVLDAMAKKAGGEMNALMRTTVAFTTAKGADAFNVIPTEAEMTSNCRIISGETRESTVETLKSIVNDPSVEIEYLDGSDPSVVSKTDCPEYKKLAAVINEVFPDAVVTPYLMIACSDSRHYGEISDRVYRFSAMAMSGEERKLIHGNDERITFRGIWEAVEFYLRLIKRC